MFRPSFEPEYLTFEIRQQLADRIKFPRDGFTPAQHRVMGGNYFVKVLPRSI